MSVVAEFMIPADSFAFGAALRTDPPMKVVLERIVATDSGLIPYVWVSNGDFERFEATARASEDISALRLLDEVNDQRLYRVEWSPETPDILAAIEHAEGAILQASGASTWTIQLRFPNHDRLGAFYSFVADNDLLLNVDNVQVLAEDSGNSNDFELTMEQREALTLAVRRGFYQVPRGSTLAALADELGVSNQATSERIRRGSNRVLQSVLLGTK